MTVFPEVVDLDDLPVRLVRRASLILETGPGVRDELAVVFDADADAFLRIPGGRPDAEIDSLSYDGTRLVLIDRGLGVHPQVTRVGIRILASGEERWFSTPDYQQDQTAVLSPDGTVLAVMGIDDPNTEDGDPPVQAVIELIDLADGRRRRIWAKTGTGDGFGLGWSPDGRKIAATYTEWQEEIDDEDWSTVVVDAATGTVLADTPWTALLGWSNGTWLDDHTVVHEGRTEDGDDKIWFRNLDTREMAVGPDLDAFQVHATIHGRLIIRSIQNGPIVYSTVALDGTDRRPLFTLRSAKSTASNMALAPGAFPPL